MQLCQIHFYQKIARKKVARVNAASVLDAKKTKYLLKHAELANILKVLLSVDKNHKHCLEELKTSNF